MATEQSPTKPVRPDSVQDAALTLFAERGYNGTSMKDIASRLGIRAPSLYNHVPSKQVLLRDVMMETMHTLIADHQVAITSTADPVEQLRRAMEAHVRYHARFPREAHIGNREIWSLEEPTRAEIRQLRRDYSQLWESLIQRGVDAGVFRVPNVRLAAYALLEMGIGVSLWFRPDGDLSESEVAYAYSDMALQLVHATQPSAPPAA